MAGRTYTRKGKAKKEGGVGRHIARKNKRRFMPNLQPVRGERALQLSSVTHNNDCSEKYCSR
jgi:ribosomal protein L28